MAYPIKLSIKTEIIPVIMILISVAASFYFYAHFPERVPSHWNFRGEIDGWSSKTMGAFFLPVLLIGMYLMFIALPLFDPKQERYEQFAKVYHIFKISILLILAATYFIASLNGLGYDISVGFWIPILIGAMFAVLGNYMGKIKMNWFVGIRTPWTLSSEEVWNKTHRFGGKVFIIGGILLASTAFLPEYLILPVFIVDILMLSLGTLAYSYIIYRQYGRKNHKDN